MAGKIVLCRCEDVTLADLEHCVSHGYRDIEEVKRYTGFGTGPCQGKECLAAVASQLALGISTLLLRVPIALAAAHQAGAVVVFTCALGLARALTRTWRLQP